MIFRNFFVAASFVYAAAYIYASQEVRAEPLVVTRCASQHLNPCGPGSVCTDTDTGFVCVNQLKNRPICPMGCGPNESCIASARQESSSLSSTERGVHHHCECNSGYQRLNPFLPCVAKVKDPEGTTVA